jgi:hypothetical protein
MTRRVQPIPADDDPTKRFSSVWEYWLLETERRDVALERALAQSYRDAWTSGGRDDRHAVINFVFDRRDEGGYDLIVDALRVADSRLASEAAAMVGVLIHEGFDLGTRIAHDLRDFGRRFPEWSSLSDGALAELAFQDDVRGRKPNQPEYS